MKWRLLLVILLQYKIVSAQEKLQYHTIKTNREGEILPWVQNDRGISYDHILNLLWNFWDTMRTDLNGLPYYMNHQVWRPLRNDPRGIGGDQLAMALESWRLYYAYSGNERVKENMRFIADYYISHSLSKEADHWASIPYPYNTLVYSGTYDGDMVLGKGYTQPDKAGSFGIELLRLYKMTSGEMYPNITQDYYLDHAITIAQTLAGKIKKGDELRSPLPFKVNARNGEIGKIYERKPGSDTILSDYTTNWSGTMELWLELIRLGKGDTALYKKSFYTLLNWMKTYPLKNNKWGPFFEDIPGWSDTQINAITFAQFMMNHPEYFPDWKINVKKIFDWVYTELGNDKWKKYGVIPINEQTAYRVPGNSHTARQAAAQLQYVNLTGDSSYLYPSLKQLDWATYMVDHDGKNKYIQDENWLTDGYGDYIRHYLKAIKYYPSLSTRQDRLVSTTSVVQHMFYQGMFDKYWYYPIKDTIGLQMHYQCFDKEGIEIIKLLIKPTKILFDEEEIVPSSFNWVLLPDGTGIITINRVNSKNVSIYSK